MARHPIPILLIDVFGSALENGSVTVTEYDSGDPVVMYGSADPDDDTFLTELLTDHEGEVEAWTEFVGVVNVTYTETDDTHDARDRRRRFDPITKVWEVGYTAGAGGFLPLDGGEMTGDIDFDPTGGRGIGMIGFPFAGLRFGVGSFSDNDLTIMGEGQSSYIAIYGTPSSASFDSIDIIGDGGLYLGGGSTGFFYMDAGGIQFGSTTGLAESTNASIVVPDGHRFGLTDFPLAGLRFGVDGNTGDVGLYGLDGSAGSFISIAGSDGNISIFGVAGLGITTLGNWSLTAAAIGINPLNNVLDLNTSRVSNVIDPAAPQDAATKAYVDARMEAYEEFLADSQTPYFMHAINPPVNYLTGTHSVNFIAEGDKFDVPLAPAQPLPALVDPFVGPGIVTDPIGYNPDDQYYTGRGAFRALKTGTLQIHWSLVTEHPSGVEGTRVRLFFAAEDGTNQMYANGSGPSTAGVLGPTSNDPERVGVSGIATLTISEFDRLDDLPYSVLFPSYPSPNYPNQFSIDGGMMPLGWDIYPWFTIENHAKDLTALTMDHFTMLIRKIA